MYDLVQYRESQYSIMNYNIPCYLLTRQGPPHLHKCKGVGDPDYLLTNLQNIDIAVLK